MTMMYSQHDLKARQKLVRGIPRHHLRPNLRGKGNNVLSRLTRQGYRRYLRNYFSAIEAGTSTADLQPESKYRPLAKSHARYTGNDRCGRWKGMYSCTIPRWGVCSKLLVTLGYLTGPTPPSLPKRYTEPATPLRKGYFAFQIPSRDTHHLLS
jgi:hypothetical protein